MLDWMAPSRSALVPDAASPPASLDPGLEEAGCPAATGLGPNIDLGGGRMLGVPQTKQHEMSLSVSAGHMSMVCHQVTRVFWWMTGRSDSPPIGATATPPRVAARRGGAFVFPLASLPAEPWSCAKVARRSATSGLP